MKWVTRKNALAERIACAWLIRRFIDEEAQFLFVEEKSVLTAASRDEAVPFDLPKHPELKFTAQHGLSTFEVLQREFEIDEAALARLAKIVRAAENPREAKPAPEAAGLRAIAQGFALAGAEDQQRLAFSFPVFDALYAWCRKNR